MTTINVKVDKITKDKYGLRSKEIEFEELRRRIISAEGLKFLKAAIRVASDVGLKKMTKKDIDQEIKAARDGSRRN